MLRPRERARADNATGRSSLSSPHNTRRPPLRAASDRGAAASGSVDCPASSRMVICRIGFSAKSSSAAASSVARTRRALARSWFLARTSALEPMSQMATPC
eukprot:1393840-Pyramimonas_sp.AAC.1